MAKAMKKFNFPSPKRGKRRAVRKIRKANACMKKHRGVYAKVPYVRHGSKTVKSRPDRTKWKRSLEEILGASEKKTIDMFKADGLLPEWSGMLCPHCAEGHLGKLKSDKNRGWTHRCGSGKCHKFVQPHDFHPIFYNKGTSLQKQGAVLFMCQANVKQSAAHICLKLDHKAIEKIYQRNDVTRLRHVDIKEKKIKFCAHDEWNDVEADEVDLGHIIDESGPKTDHDAKSRKSKKIKSWEQWGGIVERGYPDTLVLSRLNPIKTTKRAPGPGPISKRDWKPLGQKHLAGRKALLHTDGARAYKLELDQVLHDNVVHAKKKRIINGKAVWVRPKYVKVVKHKLPSTSTTLFAKAGTQVIDRFWQHLRAHLRSIGRAPKNNAMTRKIRCAQWTYWMKGKDLWLETGRMCTELFER